MPVKRIVPLGMALEAAASAEIAGVAETARVENTKVNLCPICNTPLRFCMSNNVPAMVCQDHAIVMPTKD